MTLTSYNIAAGAPDVHEHQHPEEETWTVIEGALVVDTPARRQLPGTSH